MRCKNLTLYFLSYQSHLPAFPTDIQIFNPSKKINHETYAFLNFRSVILFFTFSLLVLSSKSQDPICSPILYSDGSLGITQTGPTGETANDVWEDDCVKLKVTINDNQTNSISWSFTDGCNSITNSGLEDLQCNKP